jgi:hypothetical protein
MLRQHGKFDIEYVYGVVQASKNEAQISMDLDFVEEYYKSRRDEENKINGTSHTLTVSIVSGIDDPLDKVLGACRNWQEYYMAKYNEFRNTKFPVKAIFFSRIDLIDPVTKQTKHFKDFAALSDYLQNPLLPENDPAKFQKYQVEKLPSPNLANSRNSVWYKAAAVGVGVAAVALTASSLMRKGL